MHHKRFTMDSEHIRLPQPPAPLPTPAGFVLMPAPAMAPDEWAWRLELYQRAFELAQAVARPSLPERDLLAVWN